MVEKPSCARMVATSASTSSDFMNICTRREDSDSLLASASDSVMTFSSQPVSWLARRMFWPPRPMACESFSSATAISMLCESSSTTIDCTSAGDMALMTNCAGLSSKGMMSTRSPAISFETACTREPRMPTQAPTGSMRGSLLRTAILARTTGIAGGAQDLDGALADFRHFELEQFDQEFRRGARQEQLRTALARVAHTPSGRP